MKRAFLVLVLSLALGFLGLYLVAGGTLFEAETYHLTDPSLGLAAVCVLAVVAQWGVPGIKLRLLCEGQGIVFPYRSTLVAHLVSVLGAALTPSNTGGGPVAVVALGRLGVPSGKGLGVMVQVFVLDLVFFAWSAPLGLLYLVVWDVLSLSWRAEVLALATVGLAAAAAGVLTRRPKLVARGLLYLSTWPLLRRFDERLRNMARDYVGSARAYRKTSAGYWIKLHVVTAVGWIAGFVVLWSLLGLYGVRPGFFTVLALLASITLISTFVPTPGGSGFIEASVALAVGAGTGGVAAAVLLWRLLSFYLIFALGPVAAWLLYTSPPATFPPKHPVCEKDPPLEPKKRPEPPSA